MLAAATPAVRSAAPGEKPIFNHKSCGMMFVVIVGLVMLFAIIGSIGSDTTPSRTEVSLSPLDPKALERRDCREFLSSIAFKLYSELTEDQRKLKLYCEIVVAK